MSEFTKRLQESVIGNDTAPLALKIGAAAGLSLILASFIIHIDDPEGGHGKLENDGPGILHKKGNGSGNHLAGEFHHGGKIVFASYGEHKPSLKFQGDTLSKDLPKEEHLRTYNYVRVDLKSAHNDILIRNDSGQQIGLKISRKNVDDFVFDPNVKTVKRIGKDNIEFMRVEWIDEKGKIITGWTAVKFFDIQNSTTTASPEKRMNQIELARLSKLFESKKEALLKKSASLGVKNTQELSQRMDRQIGILLGKGSLKDLASYMGSRINIKYGDDVSYEQIVNDVDMVLNYIVGRYSFEEKMDGVIVKVLGRYDEIFGVTFKDKVVGEKVGELRGVVNEQLGTIKTSLSGMYGKAELKDKVNEFANKVGAKVINGDEIATINSIFNSILDTEKLGKHFVGDVDTLDKIIDSKRTQNADYQDEKKLTVAYQSNRSNQNRLNIILNRAKSEIDGIHPKVYEQMSAEIDRLGMEIMKGENIFDILRTNSKKYSVFVDLRPSRRIDINARLEEFFLGYGSKMKISYIGEKFKFESKKYSNTSSIGDLDINVKKTLPHSTIVLIGKKVDGVLHSAKRFLPEKSYQAFRNDVYITLNTILSSSDPIVYANDFMEYQSFASDIPVFNRSSNLVGSIDNMLETLKIAALRDDIKSVRGWAKYEHYLNTAGGNIGLIKALRLSNDVSPDFNKPLHDINAEFGDIAFKVFEQELSNAEKSVVYQVFMNQGEINQIALQRAVDTYLKIMSNESFGVTFSFSGYSSKGKLNSTAGGAVQYLDGTAKILKINKFNPKDSALGFFRYVVGTFGEGAPLQKYVNHHNKMNLMMQARYSGAGGVQEAVSAHGADKFYRAFGGTEKSYLTEIGAKAQLLRFAGAYDPYLLNSQLMKIRMLIAANGVSTGKQTEILKVLSGKIG